MLSSPNIYVDIFYRVSGNITVYADTKYGARVQGDSYDGCLGRLQSNESDVIASDLLYPTVGRQLKHSRVLFAEKMSLISTYNDNVQSSLSDLMDCFMAFDLNVWLLVATTLFGIYMLLSFTAIIFRRKVNSIIRYQKRIRAIMFEHDTPLIIHRLRRKCGKKFKSGKIMVATLILLTSSFLKRKSPTEPMRSLTITIQTCCIIFAAFYVRFYFTSMIKTEAVVSKKPVTVESYEDVLSMDRRPVWPSMTNAYQEFQNADPASKEGRIWKKAQAMGMNESLVSVMDWIAFSEEKQVWFSSGVYCRGAVANFCTERKAAGINTLPLLRSDESAIEKMYFAMMSSHMNFRTSHDIDALYERLVEAGFTELLMHAFHRRYDLNVEDFATCLSNIVRYPDQQVLSIVFEQCFLLGLTCLVLLPLSVIIHSFSFLTFFREQSAR